ncbi:MAG: hypothetical protein JW863_16795 [Chitinispirillaceae bacterium]|nr:hypothetical protein [Chitinispirillaceae bacterium]
MMRIILPIVTVLLTVTGITAQQGSVARFILSSSTDSQLIAQRTHAPVVRKNSFTMPVINDAEIRVRKGDYFATLPDDVAGLRYSLRLKPRGLGETRALKSYHDAQAVFEEELTGTMFNEQVTERYLTVIDQLERTMIIQSYNELITLYEDRIKVMDQLKTSTDFDLNDLIKAEKELSKLTVNLMEEEQELEVMCSAVAAIIGDSSFTGFDGTEFISIADVKAHIDSTEFILNGNNLRLRYLKSRFELAEERYRLEMAQNRKLVSFFELSYDHPNMVKELTKKERNDKLGDTRNAFVFEVGIKIPGLSADQQDIARRQIDFLKDREEYDQLRRELQAKMKKDESDIRALIRQYEFLTARETEVDAEASLKKYQQMSGVDPLVLLSIKENLIKNRVEKSMVYYSILRNFVYILDVTGQLSHTPLRNFLSAQCEVIQP